MAKKAAQGSSSRSASAARKGPARTSARTSADHTPLPDDRTATAREADAMAGVEPWQDGETLRERNARLQQNRVATAKQVKKAVIAEVAAPGKVHQPVKESGAGTPSADARPGRSSFSGPLEEDPEDVGARIAKQQKGRIKVQATQTGYYDDIRRRPGEVFFIHADGTMLVGKDGKSTPATAEHAFSPRWMRRVSDKTKITGTKGPNQIIRERHDEILGARVAGATTDEAGTDEDNPLEAD
jgi:hypothetical protein